MEKKSSLAQVKLFVGKLEEVEKELNAFYFQKGLSLNEAKENTKIGICKDEGGEKNVIAEVYYIEIV